MQLDRNFRDNADVVRQQAMASLFELLEEICEGAVAVDRQSRVVWISEKYVHLLELADAESVLGAEIESIIPNSLMRQVVETGRPVLLDIMQFRDRSLVVTRIPLRDDRGVICGAIGFALYDRLDYLKPLVSKFSRLQQELAEARRELARSRRAKYNLSQCVGSSAPMLRMKQAARRAAQLDSSVLLLGETGTGKELIAQAIHNASRRAAAPFVASNVAAVPEALLEAEFFGAVAGAYTGAERRGREGKFAVAEGGTLFLDEIGEMPLLLQAKLLRVLQEREFEPLGSNRLRTADVRIIAASSRDLESMLRSGSFRADLFYRLNVLPIRLPPLRERLDDLSSLCEFLLEAIATRLGQGSREVTSEALGLLASYHWPGNVRELANVLERACAMSESEQLRPMHFREVLPALDAGADTRVAGGGQAGNTGRQLAAALEACERGTIERALAVTGGNKVAAARWLGISRASLYEKLTRLRGAEVEAQPEGRSQS
jgi:transcriptional regulator with PAS, ATPase and Fis domain